MMTWWDFDAVREVEVVCGCSSLVRREAIDQVGLMDEAYFFYGDDPDWCCRFKKNGWKNYFTPEAEIIHYGGATTIQMPKVFKLQLSGSHWVIGARRSLAPAMSVPFPSGSGASGEPRIRSPPMPVVRFSTTSVPEARMYSVSSR